VVTTGRLGWNSKVEGEFTDADLARIIEE